MSERFADEAMYNQHKAWEAEQGVDTEYEAFVADVHPKFRKTGCTAEEARFAQRHPLCEFRIADGTYVRCNLDGCICLKEVLGNSCHRRSEYLLKLNEGQEERV